MGTIEEGTQSLEPTPEINLRVESDPTQNGIQQFNEEQTLIQHFDGVKLEDDEGEDEGQNGNFPLRPNASDCTFYLKTGTCKFGLNCRFNHPLKRVYQVVEEKEKENNGSSGDTGKIECKYYITTGGCKYGDACRYNHPKQKADIEAPELNFLGLPIRMGERECPFYMRNGSCGYGSNCRYHHPDPTTVKESDPDISLPIGAPVRGRNLFPGNHVNGLAPMHSLGVSQATSASSSSGPYHEDHSPYVPTMKSFHRGSPQNPGWTQSQAAPFMPENRNLRRDQAVTNFMSKADSFTHHEQPIMAEEFPERPGQPDCDYFMKHGDCKYRSACKYNHPGNRGPNFAVSRNGVKGQSSRHRSSSAETGRRLGSTPSNMKKKEGIFLPHQYQQQMQNEEHPERPGQPECAFFMKTGDCKYKSACRYHHPKDRVSAVSTCPLNDKGLPLRPGSKVCRHYEQQGICKHGVNCLFHHPDSTTPSLPDTPVSEPPPSHIPAPETAPASIEPVSDWGDGWVI